ncbi:hypothetical protein ScPMuIL_003006 [Solemya velum]
MAEMAKLIEDLQDSGTDKSNLVYRLRERKKTINITVNMAEANVPEVEASGRTTPPGVANKLRYGTMKEFCGEEESEGSSIMTAHVLDKDWCSETEADLTPERPEMSENSGEAEAMLEFENNQQLIRKNKELQKKVEKLRRAEITAKKDLAETPGFIRNSKKKRKKEGLWRRKSM